MRNAVGLIRCIPNRCDLGEVYSFDWPLKTFCDITVPILLIDRIGFFWDLYVYVLM